MVFACFIIEIAGFLFTVLGVSRTNLIELSIGLVFLGFASFLFFRNGEKGMPKLFLKHGSCLQVK